MFRIGDFARLAQVSTRTLRLYDRLGLLKPAVVDRFTDYRFYTLDQLPRLNRILALKELGFSLEQIRRMLNEELTAEQLRGMLRMKHAEAEQQACEAQERLARLEARLKQIELEEVMPNYEIVLKKIQPLAEDPNCHACQDQKMMAELKAKADASGQPLEDVFREMAGSEKDGQKTFLRRIEAPDSPPPDLTTAPRLFLRSFGQPPLDPNALPPGPTDDMIVMPFVDAHALLGVEAAAAVIHDGGPGTLSLAYRALLDWIKDNGYRVAGHIQENTLRQGESPMVELVIPVQKV